MNQNAPVPHPTSFSSLVVRHSLLLIVVFHLALSAVAQGPSSLNQALIKPYYMFPVSLESALVSFDWDASGALHYTVGDPNYGLKLEVYKLSQDTPILVYETASAWVGSLLTCIGDYIYFNDGGDYLRGDFNYYFYNASNPETVVPLLIAPYGASLWGVTGRGTDELFASGSTATWGPASLFYSPLDSSGMLESTPPVVFGEIGDSPGPMAFDPSGNLYYVPGYAYSGTATIYRWNVQEVDAALTGGSGMGLQPAGHDWATLPAPYDGATGMIADPYGNIYVTATSWGAPSQLLAFREDNAMVTPAAEYVGRLETLRYRDNAIYMSCANGIFRMPLLTVEFSLEDTDVLATVGETAVFAINATGGIGNRSYHWYRMDDQNTRVLVGTDLSHYSMTAQSEDSGTVYFCLVKDDVYSIESPHFSLTVQDPVPLAAPVILLSGAIILAVAGSIVLIKRRSPAEDIA